MSKYTLETKLKVIELYKKGFGSRQIQRKLNIPSHSIIDRWIVSFKKYGISNIGTIANWQRAYKEGGIDALFVKQGRPTMHKKIKHKKLNKSELSELEKLRLENRALHVEVEYLKKLDALVQKRGHLKKKDESSQN